MLVFGVSILDSCVLALFLFINMCCMWFKVCYYDVLVPGVVWVGSDDS